MQLVYMVCQENCDNLETQFYFFFCVPPENLIFEFYGALANHHEITRCKVLSFLFLLDKKLTSGMKQFQDA